MSGLDGVLMLATGTFVVALLVLLRYRFFDPDEFEHAHAAWCWSKGLIPYKDFFEHHTPWYYALLRELLRGFQVDSSFDSARHFLLLARVLSLALAVGSLALVTRIGRTWESRRVGLLAALFLITQPFFFKKNVELRPDVLALPFFLASLWALLRGLSPALSTGWRRRSWFVLAGLCLGGAAMCTQKMLFVLPGVLAGLGLWVLIEERWARTMDVVLFLLAFFLPGIATGAAFARLHAVGPFIFNNFLLNAHWAYTPTWQLIRLARTSGPVMVLAGYRAYRVLPTLLRPERRNAGEALLFCLLVWLFVALLVIPAAQMQYYLMPLPLLCLFAASGLDELAERAGRRVLPWALVALSILPVVNFAMDAASTNQTQFARLRRVFESTTPSDLVMDGWQGAGVFRPHAFYYYFVHDELLQMMSPQRLNAFLDDLEAGRGRPALIALDRRLVALGPRFRAFVNANYGSRDGFFYYPADSRWLLKSAPPAPSFGPIR
ncbi:MAG: ArnT family glycosyltransferase [Polyangia bacterium]